MHWRAARADDLGGIIGHVDCLGNDGEVMRILKRCVAVVVLLTVLVGTAGCLPLQIAEPLYEWSTARLIPDGSYESTEGAGMPTFNAGPALTDVTKLPLDSAGKGTIVGVAPGEAEVSGPDGPRAGSFQLILAPAPNGVPIRSEVQVHLDPSTRYFVDGVDEGRALDGLGEGPDKPDPAYNSMQMIVTFHIRDDQIWADTINEASQDLNN